MKQKKKSTKLPQNKSLLQKFVSLNSFCVSVFGNYNLKYLRNSPLTKSFGRSWMSFDTFLFTVYFRNSRLDLFYSLFFFLYFFSSFFCCKSVAFSFKLRVLYNRTNGTGLVIANEFYVDHLSCFTTLKSSLRRYLWNFRFSSLFFFSSQLHICIHKNCSLSKSVKHLHFIWIIICSTFQINVNLLVFKNLLFKCSIYFESF